MLDWVMHCLKDNVPCDTKQLEDINIDVCPLCEGVWIEQQEVRGLFRHLSMPNLSYMDELLDEWRSVEHKIVKNDDFWSEDKKVCPKDGAQMKKHYFSGSHIGVDQCHTCKGFWLDGGELHAVAEYFAPKPELDKAWQLVIRDEMDWNKMLTDMRAIPSKMMLLFAVPQFGLKIIGAFMVKVLVDNHVEGTGKL